MKIVGQLKAILGLDKSKFDQGLNQAQKGANSFASVIKKVGGILAAAFSVGAIISFSKEAMKAASEIEGIKNAFTKFGDEGKRVLEDMKKATRGVIMEDDLMKIAVQARSLNIPFKDLGVYLTFATNQAIRLGASVEDFANLMIASVGRGQARGLVQMGLSMKEANAAFKDSSGIIGYITKKVAEMGSVADTTAIKMGQFKVAGQELKEAWGAFLNKSPVIDAFRSYFTDLLKAWSDESFTFGQKAAMLLPGYGGQMSEKAVWKRGQNKTEKQREKEAAGTLSPDYFKSIQKYQQASGTATKKAERTIKDLETEIQEYKTLIDETTISDQARRNELLLQIKATEELIKKLTTLDEKIVKLESLSITPIGIKPSLPGLPGQPGLQGGPPTLAQVTATQIQEMTKALQEQDMAVGILSNAFDALFTSSEDGFKNMVDSIVTGLKRLVAEFLARIAVLTLLNVITGGGASFANILKGAAGSMFPGAAKGAEGLTVPSGYPNDTFPALLSSGETVLTARQSRSLSHGLDVRVSGDIRGRTISLIGRRTEEEN